MKKVLVATVALFSVILFSGSGTFAGDGHHGHRKHHGHHSKHHGGHHGGHHSSGHHLFHDSLDYLLAPPAYYPRYRYREYREPVCIPGHWRWGYDDYGRRMRYFVRGYCE